MSVDALREIEARLTAPGGPFEVVEEQVLGEPARVFKERMPSLRALLAASAVHGDAEYLVCDDGRRISYAENLRRVAKLASALRDRYGVRAGDRVAILAANCPEWIETFWATVSLGAIAVGLNGWWVRDEILHGLEDSEPTLLVGDARRLARISGAALPRVEGAELRVLEIGPDFDALWNHGGDVALPEAPIAEDDAATILYTSGTTGRPKGAVNTHRGILSMVRLQVFHGVRLMMKAAADAAARGVSRDGVGAAGRPCNMVNAPLFHVSGLYAGAVTSLANGLKTVWTTGRFDPVRVMQLIEAERVTAWGPMGSMMNRVLCHPEFGRHDLSSVTHLGSGGAPLPGELFARMREAFPNARTSVAIGYGLTESTALATINGGEELLARPDSVGRPLPTIDVEIRDADGKPLPEGAEGEICLRGPLVMREYWRRPRETTEAIGPGRWLRTGDVGRLEDGYLYINSRRRDLILRGAENVYPAEVEQALEAHDAVHEAAVVGVDHPELGQEVKAIVVVAETSLHGAAAQRMLAEELSRWVAGRLAYFKVPAHWEFRSAPLPRNATGKVLKNVLTSGALNPFVEE
ncbi:MAG: acyl-CoA synthetase (AMP-forming)/AMP-acid ligase [Deltaproteobacteria bacterium]|nr:acyl-CoA synthetase (AMP-forming)/AMP-acid ligase [Deltaproteobacteria bacterium]